MYMRLIKNPFFLSLILLKLSLLALFSSGYKDDLFVPFITYFTETYSNPWEYFFINHLPNSFPYPAFMLYILYPFQLVSGFFHFVPINNFIFKLPILLADFVILIVLNKLFPARSKEILAFYFASPIIFYAAYIHSQLDLIPTAFLFVSIYLLVKDKTILSALILGLAISTKFHVIAALPLILIYLWKKKGFPFTYLLTPLLTYFVLNFPFLFSQGFLQFVFRNKEQLQVFNVTFSIGELKIYLSLLVVLLIYIRFAIYKKINNDLFFSYTGLLFSAFLIFVPPMPGWYIWIVPFLLIYFINAYNAHNERIFILDAALSLSYLVYFVVFHLTPYTSVKLLEYPLDLKIDDPYLKNIAFTVLTSCLIAVVYYLYNFGVRSNSIYKKSKVAFAIGIGGDSGSGKSILLSDLKSLLHHKHILEFEGDGDHKWERGNDNWQEFTHLNPKANFLHRQSEDLSALKSGQSVERVVYDHDTGKFTSPVITKSNDFIVITGLHPFYLPKMRKNINLKVYLETEENLRWHWKIIRDSKKRAYSKEQVINQIKVRMPDAEKYIHPQKMYADLIISYFSDDEYVIGDESFHPRLSVKFTVDSNVDLDPLVIELIKSGIREYEHDYSEDLHTQYLILRDDLTNLHFDSVVDTLVPNKEEIILKETSFSTGIRGLVQLILLIMISEKMKEDIH